MTTENVEDRPPAYATEAIVLAEASFPTISDLPRPGDLFARTAPFHLLLTHVHKGILIQGTHPDSLKLMKQYFDSWMKPITNDVRKLPVLTCELGVSHVDNAHFYDSLKISATNERQSWVEVNPVLIMGFIEGVLGYELMPRAPGEASWYYRRDIGWDGEQNLML